MRRRVLIFVNAGYDEDGRFISRSEEMERWAMGLDCDEIVQDARSRQCPDEISVSKPDPRQKRTIPMGEIFLMLLKMLPELLPVIIELFDKSNDQLVQQQKQATRAMALSEKGDWQSALTLLASAMYGMPCMQDPEKRERFAGALEGLRGRAEEMRYDTESKR